MGPQRGAHGLLHRPEDQHLPGTGCFSRLVPQNHQTAGRPGDVVFKFPEMACVRVADQNLGRHSVRTRIDLRT